MKIRRIARQARELIESLGLYAIAFASMTLAVPGALVRNPLFIIPTAVLAVLRLAGGLDWSWWAITSPTWAMLALYGAHSLAANARRERDRRAAERAAEDGRTLGVFRRLAGGGIEDAAVYIGSADSCRRYVREHADSAAEAEQRFCVRKVSSSHIISRDK